jgi:hypothetical protein
MTSTVRVAVSAEQLDAVAAEVIRKLAGPAARVRDDQLSAVRALVTEHRRGPGRCWSSLRCSR